MEDPGEGGGRTRETRGSGGCLGRGALSRRGKSLSSAPGGFAWAESEMPGVRWVTYVPLWRRSRSANSSGDRLRHWRRKRGSRSAGHVRRERGWDPGWRGRFPGGRRAGKGEETELLGEEGASGAGVPGAREGKAEGTKAEVASRRMLPTGSGEHRLGPGQPLALTVNLGPRRISGMARGRAGRWASGKREERRR